jgi:hypothetical protein
MKKIFTFVSVLAVLILLAGCATLPPLTDAVYKGDIKTANTLLDKGADIDEWFYGTPLMYASANGKNEMVNLLLKRGANINARSKGGESALGLAAENTHVSTVKLLVSKGADTDSAIIGLDKRAAFFSGFPPLPGAAANCKRGIELIKNIVRRQESAAAQAAKPSTLTKEDLTMIVQAAVEGASKTHKNKTKVQSSVQSDIDKPFFSTESKIMDDNDYAIIIGIEGYSSLPKSDYSYDDAKLVKEYIKALGIKERNIELLTDEKATLSGIMKSIEAWLPNKLKKGGKVFVYYSGHGSPNPVTGEAFLVPYDGDPNYLDVTGYPLKRLYEKLGRLQASEVIVVLDSCFSGAGGRSVLAKGARPLVMTSQSAVLPQNMVVLSATQSSQISTSSQEKGYGIFTYYFLKALKDGKKSVAEIYEHIKPYVEDEAKSINVRQSPSINPDLDRLKERFLLRK